MNQRILTAIELKRTRNVVLDQLSSGQVDEVIITRDDRVLGVMRPSAPSEKVRSTAPAVRSS